MWHDFLGANSTFSVLDEDSVVRKGGVEISLVVTCSNSIKKKKKSPKVRSLILKHSQGHVPASGYLPMAPSLKLNFTQLSWAKCVWLNL